MLKSCRNLRGNGLQTYFGKGIYCIYTVSGIKKLARTNVFADRSFIPNNTVCNVSIWTFGCYNYISKSVARLING
jgi:phosphatidylserine synthase